MDTNQAIEVGVIQAKSRLAVVEAAFGPVIAAEYAKGMALHARDYLRGRIGERGTCFWFVCLGQDAITEPGGNMTEQEKPCAPAAAQRLIEIERSTFEELQALAKRTHTSMPVMINSALNAWLGKI